MHRERNKEHFSILRLNKSCYKKVNSRENWGRRETKMRKYRQRDLKTVHKASLTVDQQIDKQKQTEKSFSQDILLNY